MRSIRNKIVISIFGITLVSTLAITALGYINGTRDLKRQGRERLAAIRGAKQSHIENSLDELHRRTAYHADSLTITESMVRFVKAFDEMRQTSVSPDAIAATKTWYETVFVEEYEEHGEKLMAGENLLPVSNVARNLQYRYIVENPNPLSRKNELIECGDGSEYDVVHRTYQEKFDSFLKSFDYQDLLFFHPETCEVVYTTLKQIDLGVSMKNGPFAGTKLAEALRKMQADPVKGQTRLVDFEWYVPAFGHPVAFILSPVFQNGKFAGLMALAIATESFDKIIFSNQSEISAGLEKTGDIYLFGEDSLMRSDCRLLIEDPEAYAARLRASGIAEEVVRKVRNYGSTIMIMSTNPNVTKSTFEGLPGESEFTNLLGKKVLASYSVLKIRDLRWGIVAMIDSDELLQGVNEFTRNALLGGAVIVAISTLLAALAGQAIAAPVRQLNQAAKAFSNGFLSVRVNLKTRDELAQLAQTFNAMAAEIENRTAKNETRTDEYRRLLENMMPAVVMSRFRQTGADFTETPYQSEATLAFIEIKGIEKLYEEFGTSRASVIVRELQSRLANIAETHRVEMLTSGGSSILVASGLNEAHFDHSPRVLNFAQDLLCELTTFNAEKLTRLYLSVGVHRGLVGTGKIGRQAFIDDLWGRTIELSKEIHEIEGKSAIRVSQEIVDRVGDRSRYSFVRDDVGTNQPTWTLTTESIAPNFVKSDDAPVR